MGILLDPIVIDRETGEPKNVPDWWPETKEPWKVVILLKAGGKKGKKFRKYSEAKAFADKFKDDERVESVTVVSRAYAFGPPSKITEQHLIRANMKGLTWCPYCRKFTDYLYDPYTELKRCVICSVSDRNNTVRQCNPRYWGD